MIPRFIPALAEFRFAAIHSNESSIMHLYKSADTLLIAMNKGIFALMLAMLVALPMSGCVGREVTPATIPVEKLEEGWARDPDNSGGATVGTIFSAYVNIYRHNYQKIDDGLIVLAKMSDISFVDEVGTLDDLIEKNLDDVVQKLEKELNCTITIVQQSGESAAIDGYNVTLHKLTLSGTSKDGSVSGNVIRAAWKCSDGVVAVLGISISNYKQGNNAAIAPATNQWSNVNEMVCTIDC